MFSRKTSWMTLLVETNVESRPFTIGDQIRVLSAALLFGLTGWESAHRWYLSSSDPQFHVGILFGVPLALCNRCRNPLFAPGWIAGSFLIWCGVYVIGTNMFLLLNNLGIAITGMMGAMLCATVFALLSRRMRIFEFFLISLGGLAGGVVFAMTGKGVNTGSGEFLNAYAPSPVGFISWQVAVGTALVLMSCKKRPRPM
jgi:hypothetical protein